MLFHTTDTEPMKRHYRESTSVTLHTCERQALRVGVTERLQGKKIEVHVCFIDVHDRKNKQKKRETGKMLTSLATNENSSHGRAEWTWGTVLEQRSKRAMNDEEGLRELNPFKSPK